jgi:hypothetical protein
MAPAIRPAQLFALGFALPARGGSGSGNNSWRGFKQEWQSVPELKPDHHAVLKASQFLE